MIGIIFSIFFFILGLFEFFGNSTNPQIALELFLISAMFYIGYSIYFGAISKKTTSDSWVKAFGEVAKIISKTKYETSNSNNKEDK